MNIVLIGFRGSGKTSLGKRLAAKLWLDFVDTDSLITQRAGQSIKEIFDAQGEPAFRALETQVIADVAAKDNQVISAGGGSVLNPANIAALKARAKIVWLKASPKTLHDRIQADPATAASRPNTPGALTTGTLEEIQTLLAAREPLYQAAADVSLEVTYLTPEDAVQRLASLI